VVGYHRLRAIEINNAYADFNQIGSFRLRISRGSSGADESLAMDLINGQINGIELF
jgi:hypothetical protein